MCNSFSANEREVSANVTKTLVLGKLGKNSGWALDFDPKVRLIDIIKEAESGKCLPIRPIGRVLEVK